MILRIRAAITGLGLSLVLPLAPTAPATPILSRVPNQGIQPQVVVEEQGTVHLLYFLGDPKGGDLFYSRRSANSEKFGAPLRVNSATGSAVAIGTIRGGQIAIGQNGRIHVAWNGAGAAAGHPGSAMFYARLNDQGTAFEPQRDLITHTGGLDGGGCVAADSNGSVYVGWHGIARAGDAEADRAVFLSVSRDDGRHFEPERRINPEPTGACACCGLKIFSGNDALYLLYRAARAGTGRDQIFLSSLDQGKSFHSIMSHSWQGSTCPMSAACLGTAHGNTIAAWENRGRIWISAIDGRPAKVTEPFSPPGANQKYPAIAANPAGELLVVWVEGAGWQKGGMLCWQLFDNQNKPSGAAGHANSVSVPAWSFAAAWARADQGFEILY